MEKRDNKLLSFSQVIIPWIIAILGLFVASSFLGNRAVVYLGDPLFYFDSVGIYTPEVYIHTVSFYIEQRILETEFDSHVLHSIYILLGFLTTAVVTYYLMSVLRGAQENTGLYGSARMGTEQDLKKYGFLRSVHGVILGQKHEAIIAVDDNGKMQLFKIADIIADSGDTHTIIVAPSRSGKGISTVIPTLLYYHGSVIVFDPKGENYATTAGARRVFSSVLKFSPVDPFSIRFNPLAEIRRDANAYRDASTIASILTDAEKKQSGGDDHWTVTATDLLTGAILHVAFANDIDAKDAHLGTVLDVLSGKGVSATAEESLEEIILKKIIATPHANAQVHGQITTIIQRALSKADKERSSVFSTATSKLFLLEDPNLRENLSASDIKIEDFYNSKHPISLYLTVPYSDVTRLAPIIRLLVSFMIRKFTEGETRHGEQKLKHQVLFLLDEFPTLGRFKFLETTLGIIAGYNCRFVLIIQSFTQLDDVYGQNNPFLEHCKTWVVFAPGELKSAKALSEIIGKTSVYKENVTSSGSKTDIGMKNISLSGSEVQVNVLNPDELMKLPRDEVLIFAHGMPPYRGKKILFYQDKRFLKQANWTPPQNNNELYDELPFAHAPKRVAISDEENQKQVAVLDNEVADMMTDDVADEYIEESQPPIIEKARNSEDSDDNDDDNMAVGAGRRAL